MDPNIEDHIPDGSSNQIRVVVVDDQPLMLRAISELIEQDQHLRVVGRAQNGREGLEAIHETYPDVVLTDLDMPVMNGVDLIAALQDGSSPKTVALTTFATTDWVVAALRAGASGYLVKDAVPDEIVNAVRQILDNTMIVSPAVVELLSRYVVDFPFPASHISQDAIPQLSDREKAIIELLATGMSNREIAENMYLSEGSIKLHLSKVCEKFRVRDRVQLLVRAIELGIAYPRLGGSHVPVSITP